MNKSKFPLLLTLILISIQNSFAQQNTQAHSLVPDPNFTTQTGQRVFPGTIMGWASPNPDQPPVYVRFSIHNVHGDNNTVGWSGDGVYWGMKPTAAGKADSYVLVQEIRFYRINETGITEVYRKDIPEADLLNARHRWPPDPNPAVSPSVHNRDSIVPDPNLPVMGYSEEAQGTLFDGTRKYPEAILSWVTRFPNHPPDLINFGQSADPNSITGQGIYLGMKWTGPATADSYIGIGGRYARINGWEVVWIPKSEVPPAGQLFNERRKLLAANTASFRQNMDEQEARNKPAQEAFKKAQQAALDSARATPGFEEVIENSTLTPKKDAAGVFILTYTDPRTNKSVTVQVKRVLDKKFLSDINGYAPALKQQVMLRLNYPSGGDFVKVPLAGNAQKFRIYSIGMHNDLVVHPEKNITDKPADWPDDWQTQLR